MSGSKGTGAGNGQPIPAGSRNMVHSLKEIVNCSEAEIYAALKECNMDPNEAVNRLLTQDPFHEVKSKREKKKEGKDTTEPKSRGTNSNSSRGGKIGNERSLGHGGSTMYNLSDSSHFPGKPLYKKENGSHSQASYMSSIHAMVGYGRGRGPATLSDGISAQNKPPLFGANDSESSGSVLPSKSSWVSNSGQVSMADILKMGRSYSNVPNAHSSSHPLAPSNLRYSEDLEPKNPEARISPVLNVQMTEEWPSMEKIPTSTVLSAPEYNIGSEHHVEVSSVPSDQLTGDSELEAVQETENYVNEMSRVKEMGSGSLPGRKILDDRSRDPSLYEKSLYENMSMYQHQAQDLHGVDEVGESLSSIIQNLEKLSVEKRDRNLLTEGYVPSVVIPDHLQVHDADCSHLSFGSFGAGMSIVSSGSAVSAPMNINLDKERHSEPDISSVGHTETKSPRYYVDDSLRNASDGGLLHGTGSGAGSYDPSVSQPDELKHESAEIAHRNQYSFASANTSHSFEDAQHLNTTYNQTSLQMEDLPFSNVMSSYTNSFPSAFSAANAHSSRESDLQYSPFPSSQSMSAKYGNSISSIGGSAVASEDFKTSTFPQAQPPSSGNGVAPGPPLPQHLTVHHPYSQPSLPLGPFANLIPYPFVAQSYTYMPSAFQQAFAGNSAYPQSLASVLPQYKNTVPPSTLPQSAAVAAGYGGFGSDTVVPGNFQMTPPAAPSATSLNYEDVSSLPYKDNSQLMSLLQAQNENSAPWLQGPNSRTMPAVAANTYYNYPANYPPGGFRQAQQQPSQSYGAALGGYPNMYHSQAGLSPEQPQNTRDVFLGGSQGQPKQTQLWQGGY